MPSFEEAEKVVQETIAEEQSIRAKQQGSQAEQDAVALLPKISIRRGLPEYNN